MRVADIAMQKWRMRKDAMSREVKQVEMVLIFAIDISNFQTQAMAIYYRILPLRYIFQVVQTQTTTAYCTILPTLDYHL